MVIDYQEEEKMMEINKVLDGEKAVLLVSGRLDTTTAPELETTVLNIIGQVKDLTFDFKDLEYISSAGLRVLLMAVKRIDSNGNMVITNCNDEIMEIFEVTGFSDVLNIQ